MFPDSPILEDSMAFLHYKVIRIPDCLHTATTSVTFTRNEKQAVCCFDNEKPNVVTKRLWVR